MVAHPLVVLHLTTRCHKGLSPFGAVVTHEQSALSAVMAAVQQTEATAANSALVASGVGLPIHAVLVSHAPRVLLAGVGEQLLHLGCWLRLGRRRLPRGEPAVGGVFGQGS